MLIFNNIIWNVNPVISQLGWFELRYYSLLFALGFIIGYIIVRKIYIKENISLKELDSLLVWVVLGGLLGARIGHCIFYEWNYYKYNFLEIILPFSFNPEFHFFGYHGLASHGGAAGIIVSLIIFKYFSTNKSFFWLIDRVVIPAGFAGGLIRLGNLMNSEIYGHSTDLPWGFVFVRNGDILPSHPTQIYEAFFYIITSIALLIMYKNKKYRNAKGLLFGVFLVMIFIPRFFIEFIKINQMEFENEMLLNMGQVLSIPIIATGMFFIIKNYAFLNKTIADKKNN